MPPAKKAAKKAVRPAEDKSGKDLRRAYEHTSRVEILRRLLPPGATDPIATLVACACRELDASKEREAADLLRASEHLSFAALALPAAENAPLTPELKAAIDRQFAEIGRRADDRWEEEVERPEVLAEIYRHTRLAAARAYEEGAWHQALEFVRAAEALAQVDGSESAAPERRKGPRALSRGNGKLKLVASR